MSDYQRQAMSTTLNIGDDEGASILFLFCFWHSPFSWPIVWIPLGKRQATGSFHIPKDRGCTEDTGG
jgi:hypothetical protein